MSSVTMAADSTQADFIHHRVRPAVKGASGRSGFGRGHQQGHRRDRSRSRHRSSSSRSYKPKRRSKEHQVKKVHRRHEGSRSHDDTSDRDSDLDLSKDLLPISGYVRIKDEMIDHMFRSISNRKLRAMLPEILRPLSSDELRRLCVEQLEVMSKKRICRILGGADPETISSSGTEEDDDDEEEGSSGSSSDAEGDGPDVGNAYAENEAVNSTSLPAVDDLPLKDSNVTSHLENEDNNDNGSDRNDNPAVNSSKNKELAATVDAGRDSHSKDRDDGVMGGKIEEEGEEASTLLDKASKIDHGGLDGDEIFGITIKINDARFQMEDPEASADVGGGCSQEESMKMNKRNIERSYRAKQLDDDERENDSDGGGGRQRSVKEEVGLGIDKVRSKPKEKDKEGPSDSESIPSGLPSLDSEPEETCCPYVFLDTKSSQELKKSVDVDQRNSSSGKLPDATSMTGGTESKESSTDCGLVVSQDRSTHGKISSLDQLSGPDAATTIPVTNKTREQKESVDETVQDVSETDNKDKSLKKSSPTELRTLSSVIESVNDGEEMIIEIHEHEFSDDVGDDDGRDGDAGFERERENERKKVTEDSVKSNKVLTEVPQHKEAKGSDVQCMDEETKLTDDKRLPSSEKLEMENNRGLPGEDDNALAGKTILGRPKASDGEQRGLKRRSVEIADERLQSKMQKLVGKATSGERRSEERSDSNSEQKKCFGMKNSGMTDGKAVLASKADIESENRPNSVSSLDTSHRSESGGSSRASVSLPTPKRDTSLVEQNVSKSPSKLSRASSTEDMSSRRVIKLGNSDAASSGRARIERPELQISSSRVEPSENVEAAGRLTTSKTPNRTPSQQKLSSADRALSSETGKEPATPTLSKTQLEILELEMRARAIKAMLKAQEELEKREEKVKLDEKRRSVISSAGQLPRSSQATEGRSVVRPESKMIRIGTSYRGEAASGPKTPCGADSAQRVIRGDVATPRQAQDKRLVDRRPAAALAEGVSFTRTVQSSQASVTRPGFKSFRDVVASNKFPTSAYRLVKRPLASATRGRGGVGGAGSSCTSSRIVRLSSGPRADNRSVVPAQKLTSMRQTSGGPDKTAKMAGGDREDVRRVVASSPASARGSQALKVMDSSLRYGHRDRAHGPSPNRDQKRSVVAWNRRGVNYKQQVSRAGRF